MVAMNENAFQASYGNRSPYDQNFIRTAIAAHEHGHAITLRHDMSFYDPEYYDLTCGGMIPVTIMDTRCAEVIQVNQGTA
jgi:hypothetical protein